MQIFLSLLAILLFIGLVLVHEWGHFIVARRNGVDVREFGLGFPPRAVGRKLKSGMILSLNWLPLGGFVKLKGEHDYDTRPKSFGAASVGVKTKILLAGVTMNLFVGLFILTILAMVGMPKLITSDLYGHDQFTVKSDTKLVKQEVRAGIIEPNSPASRAGLNGRDVIVRISDANDTRLIKTYPQLHSATQDFAGKTVAITYRHNGNSFTKTVTLRSKSEVQASLKTDNPKGYLGVENPTSIQIVRSTWSAPVVAVGFTGQLIALTAQGLWHALSGLGSAISGAVTGNHVARENGQTQASSQVGGPVAIAMVLWNSGSLGAIFVLWLIAVISLTLAFMNILPIPALDGGRLAMILISRGIFKRPLSHVAEERIINAGMLVLLSLIVLITVVDVKRF